MKRSLLILAVLTATALSAQTIWLPTKAVRTQSITNPKTGSNIENITWAYDRHGNTVIEVLNGDTTYTRTWTELPNGELAKTYEARGRYDLYIAEYDAKGMLMFEDNNGTKFRTIVNEQGVRIAVEEFAPQTGYIEEQEEIQKPYAQRALRIAGGSIAPANDSASTTWYRLPCTFDSKGHILEDGTYSYTWDENGQPTSMVVNGMKFTDIEVVRGVEYFDEWSLFPFGGIEVESDNQVNYPDMDKLRQWNDNTLHEVFANINVYIGETLIGGYACTVNDNVWNKSLTINGAPQESLKIQLLENGGYIRTTGDANETYEEIKTYDQYGALTRSGDIYYDREYDAEGRPTRTTCHSHYTGDAIPPVIFYTETYSTWTEKGTVDIQTVDMDDAIQWTAYAKDGYITVEGIDDYIIVNTSGAILPANKTLPTGIYFVSANGKTQKVIVP